MASETTIDVDQIAGSLQLAPKQVARAAELLDAGNTVPFITRYRKDQTGGLDEVQIRNIQQQLARLRQLAERKQTILRSIETQGKLTPELTAAITAAKSTKALEDLYLPFKPKKQTLATQARERGLGPLADQILAGDNATDLSTLATPYVDSEKQLTTVDDVLAGVGHIIAETFSERADLRQALRRIYRNTAQLVSTGQPAAEAKPSDTAPAKPPASVSAPILESPTDPAQPVAEAADQVNTTSNDSEPGTTDQQQTVAAKKKSTKKADKRRAQEEKLRHAFRDYFDFRQKAAQVPPHRVLAINRGERKKMLKIKVDIDIDKIRSEAERILVADVHPQHEILKQCVADALSRLILPSLDRELRRELTEKAENHATEVFAKNLRNLLLQPPVLGRRVLALDPGFRSGAKMVALDEFGSPLANDVIHIVGSEERLTEGRANLVKMIQEHQLNVVAIGNGTACRETEKLVGQVLANELSDNDVGYAVVNEAGASVYSTSQLGRDEFPDYDATVRGAVSIGRRLLDPLSELVKIDPASIGVGLYQHDVKAKHLRESLDGVVESCVNFVGVDVNSASPALLRYVSGMNQLTAQRVFDYRKQHGPFRSRKQLLDVPGLGEAKFVQAAGFLKIVGGENPLDASWIHPESYEVADRVLAKLGLSALKSTTHAETDGGDSDASDQGSQPDAFKAAIAQVEREQLAAELEIGPLLLDDILTDLTRPGRDPREDLPPPIFRHEVLKLEDLEVGMELAGTVLNVVDFGAFIDIGLHDSALVHISQLGSRYVRDPHDVVSVGDVVNVWVMSTDKERRRVALTMIEPGTEPAKRERPSKQRRTDSGGQPARKRKGQGAKSRSAKKTRSQTTYKPKPKPKPVVPLTEDMKKGNAPLRTFGDLAQFVDLKNDDSTSETEDKNK